MSEILKITLWFSWITNQKLGQFFQDTWPAVMEANIAFFVECILHHAISLKWLNCSHFMTHEPLFLLHVVKLVVICEHKRVKNYQSKISFYCICHFWIKTYLQYVLCFKVKYNRKSSNFNFQWTITLYQSNFKYNSPFFHYLKANDINICLK